MLFQKLVQDNSKEWEAYIHHRFVQQLHDQSLRQEHFLFYLKQDYLYLIQFAKCAARLAINSRNVEELHFAFKIAEFILEGEIQMHQSILSTHNLDLRTLEDKNESLVTIAYSRYVLNVGECGDYIDMLTALSSCILGYAAIGKELIGTIDEKTIQNHLYRDWIFTYGSEVFQAFAKEFETFFNRYTQEVGVEKFARLSNIFCKVTQLESAFWEHALQ